MSKPQAPRPGWTYRAARRNRKYGRKSAGNTKPEGKIRWPWRSYEQARELARR